MSSSRQPYVPDFVRIPLAGSFKQRGLSGETTLAASKDQRFLNCTFDVVTNPILDNKTIYVERRPGWGVDSIVSAGNVSSGLIKPQSFSNTLSAFGTTNSTIYLGGVSIGTITGIALHFSETSAPATGGGSVPHVMIKSSDGTGWYFPSDANDTLSYAGNTHTNTVIDGIPSTVGMYIGQALSGTGIQAGTRVATITSSVAITITLAATGTASITITKEPIAKIIDTDFITTGTAISAFVPMNGYLFYTTDDGNLRNSDLNSVTAYTSTSFIATSMAPDPPRAVAQHKNMIVVFGSASKEVFFNNENTSGSPLERAPQYFERIGTLDQKSVATLENDIFFVSSPAYGDVGVWQMHELTSQKISTPVIDRLLGSIIATGGSVYLSSFRLGGYPYISLYVTIDSSGATDTLLLEDGSTLLLEDGTSMLMEGSATITSTFSRQYVYNSDLKLWSEWDASIASYITGTASGVNNQLSATSRVSTDGKIYTINPASAGQLYKDDTTLFSTEIRTSKVDLNTSKRKFVSRIRLIGDVQTTGTASLSWSDDDGATFSTARNFDLTQTNPQILGCGSHRGGRIYKVTHATNGPFRAEALDVFYTLGLV